MVSSPEAALTDEAILYHPNDGPLLETRGRWVGSLVVTLDRPRWCRRPWPEREAPTDEIHRRAARIAASHGGTHLRRVDEDRSLCSYGYNGPCRRLLPTAQYYVLRVERAHWAELSLELQPR